jgi:Asp-tRNA(Asn)/Glu-tRNA(Gln) amidotransferase A subunit family amidase
MTPVTERSALDLAAAIRRREVSAQKVVDAHIERHIRVGPRINAVVAERFAAAREEALAADRRIAAGDGDAADLPPLLGVPFTLKESIALSGMPNSSGLVARASVRAAETAPVAQRLIEAGAIPLGVTNTSELTLWIESENRVYGRTNNPYDARRTAGGSSGGEGAAVGSGGSPFGIGSDIAGSIRIPAFFCGVFGHKPSSGLVPNTGSYPPTPGDAGRLLGTGPLARRAEDLMPLLRIMAGPDGVDPVARRVQLSDPVSVSLDGLRVATVENSSLLPMTRELRDARERAVGALAAAGAVVRRVEFRSWRRALLPYLATLQAGTTRATLALLGEAGLETPTFRTLLGRGSPHTLPTRLTLAAELLPQLQPETAEKLVDTGRKLAAEIVEAIGDGVVLHPAHARAAPRHGWTVGRPWLFTPAAMFNLAGVPVTEVPLGLDSRGLPLGVQVAAGLDRDHVSIAVAQALERAFGGWVPPRISENLKRSTEG